MDRPRGPRSGTVLLQPCLLDRGEVVKKMEELGLTHFLRNAAHEHLLALRRLRRRRRRHRRRGGRRGREWRGTLRLDRARCRPNAGARGTQGSTAIGMLPAATLQDVAALLPPNPWTMFSCKTEQIGVIHVAGPQGRGGRRQVLRGQRKGAIRLRAVGLHLGGLRSTGLWRTSVQLQQIRRLGSCRSARHLLRPGHPLMHRRFRPSWLLRDLARLLLPLLLLPLAPLRR
mmetsp:Transcript_17686/g.45740  ORF Transcript_17686/g.45740 Transcript_17686/m.45740 type:complete len:229 (+) Transcript_17686:1096-1782(+)